MDLTITFIPSGDMRSETFDSVPAAIIAAKRLVAGVPGTNTIEITTEDTRVVARVRCIKNVWEDDY
jgi:hypothetical protein